MSQSPPRAAAGAADIEAARILLDRLGMSPEDLLGLAAPQCPAPTFAEYIPVVAKAVPAGSRRAYSSYRDLILEAWPDRRLDEVKASEIEQLAEQIKANAVVRRNARGGRGAAENFITALRCIYRRAIADGHIEEGKNRALKVAKPRRLESTRRALTDAELAQINQATASTGNDPVLDSLLLRLRTETACRRGGTVALRPVDLDPDQCLIMLREKGGTVRWQPVSPTLKAHLQHYARERLASSKGQLLRYADGSPITDRRYDHLWARIGAVLPWVETQQVTAHWLRYTTLTYVERNFGYAVAQAYAGHAPGSGGSIGVTVTYVRATLQEIVRALAALTGEPHPLL
ncbi:tyrosine-type recombinase/integrase [Dactylosporangium vinaceum]|uniref:Tyrosine-type recombinase/integrase n=1 Tax=Dactylosporangium vinaceum TaxID=53362 RepID=A0ABV5MQT2_9ACTN|nr:tyrosine-type recombinase/integrase [Dactylosporangium vinaceum]UAB93833.1 tyrosine-type recombinase/integrase [Dactylosporangium vinaceum]